MHSAFISSDVFSSWNWVSFQSFSIDPWPWGVVVYPNSGEVWNGTSHTWETGTATADNQRLVSKVLVAAHFACFGLISATFRSFSSLEVCWNGTAMVRARCWLHWRMLPNNTFHHCCVESCLWVSVQHMAGTSRICFCYKNADETSSRTCTPRWERV